MDPKQTMQMFYLTIEKFANSTLQPTLNRTMMLARLKESYMWGQSALDEQTKKAEQKK